MLLLAQEDEMLREQEVRRNSMREGREVTHSEMMQNKKKNRKEERNEV